MVQNRERECGGFTSAGLREPQKVTAFQQVGNSPGLNRRGRGVTLFCESLLNWLGKFEFGETGH